MLFNRLQREQIARIVGMEVDHVRERLRGRGLRLGVSAGALSWLAGVGPACMHMMGGAALAGATAYHSLPQPATPAAWAAWAAPCTNEEHHEPPSRPGPSGSMPCRREPVPTPLMLRLSPPRYDPAYGARPVRRAVRQYVLNPLAQELLGFQQGLEGARVVVDALDGQVRIRVLGKDDPAGPEEGGEGFWGVEEEGEE